MTKGGTAAIVIYLNFQDLFTYVSGHEQNKNAEALVKTLRVCDDFGLRCKKHLAI